MTASKVTTIRSQILRISGYQGPYNRLQGVSITPETCVAITPESCVAITPITRKFEIFLDIQGENLRFRSNFWISAKGHFCGFGFYNTNQSEISRRE